MMTVKLSKATLSTIDTQDYGLLVQTDLSIIHCLNYAIMMSYYTKPHLELFTRQAQFSIFNIINLFVSASILFGFCMTN